MKVEVGKRYRFVRTDGQVEEVVVELANDRDLFIVTDARKGSWRLWLLGGEDGAIQLWGKLEEFAPPSSPAPAPAPTTANPLRPLLGDDPGAFADLKERFKTWDFSVGTY